MLRSEPELKSFLGRTIQGSLVSHTALRSSHSPVSARLTLTAAVSLLLALVLPGAVGPAVAEPEDSSGGGLVVQVSTLTPYKDPVTITVDDLPEGDYLVVYISALVNPNDPEAPLFNPFRAIDSVPVDQWSDFESRIFNFLLEPENGSDVVQHRPGDTPGTFSVEVADWFTFDGAQYPGVILILDADKFESGPGGRR